ncbi:hypothetical protein ID866_12431, partial [Astraeus odoratus]
MRAELTQGGNTYVEPNALISMSSMVISMHPTPLPLACMLIPRLNRQPPLSAWHSSLTTPHQEPCIRTLAEELEDAEFRTPDGPRGNDPDNDDGGNDNAPDPDAEDNPLLVLTNTISHLSHATRCKPKDSGAVCTKVHEPDTFDDTDPKKLCEFLIQCELNFHDRPQAFHLDSRKVSFALSFLKGIALAWFEPDLLNAILGAEPTWADDYSEFVIELTINFSPHNPIGDAEHQLNNLQSGNSSGTTSSSSAGKKPQQP